MRRSDLVERALRGGIVHLANGPIIYQTMQTLCNNYFNAAYESSRYTGDPALMNCMLCFRTYHKELREFANRAKRLA